MENTMENTMESSIELYLSQIEALLSPIRARFAERVDTALLTHFKNTYPNVFEYAEEFEQRKYSNHEQFLDYYPDVLDAEFDDFVGGGEWDGFL